MAARSRDRQRGESEKKTGVQLFSFELYFLKVIDVNMKTVASEVDLLGVGMDKV